MRRIATAFLAALVVSSLYAKDDSPYRVRMFIKDSLPLVNVSFPVRTTVLLKKPFTFEVLDRVSSSRIVVQPSVEGIAVNGILYEIFGLVIEPQGKNAFRVNNKPYRGSVGVVKKSNTQVTLTHLVGLEEYVRGVVANEIYSDWPAEALRAQAIVSRTFALYKMTTNLYADFDVSATTQDQRYAPAQNAWPSITRAVDDTRGIVLLYRGNIFPAFFHAACGGRTGNASHYWDMEEIPPLKGVYCSACRKSPFYRWEKRIPLTSFLYALSGSGIKLNALSSVWIENTQHGKEVVFNRRIRISAYRLRTFLGDDYLRSPDFTIRKEKDVVVIRGKGWGHGVGLCQWGAKKLAEEGRTFAEILQFYYPQSGLGVLDE